MKLIQERNVFPCYFGSALKLTGVDGFHRGLEAYLRPGSTAMNLEPEFIRFPGDSQGTRLTWMKVTGGSLKVKQVLEGSWINSEGQQEIWKEKADQIRIYSGAGYELAQEAPAGTVCAVTGLEKTCSGQGLGAEESGALPLLEPVLTYRIILPPGVRRPCDV